MKSNIKKVIVGILFLVVLLVVVVILGKHNLTIKSEQKFHDRFNQIPENPDPEDIIGLSLANLPANEEKEIHEIIKKAFEGQYLYRYQYKSEDETDKLMEDLYIPEEYQQFKEKLKEGYKSVNRENSLEDILSSLKKIKFSKLREYRDFDDRIGIIGEPKSCNAHYFLFKKVDNYWKIEKEIWHIKSRFLDETLIIKQLIEQKNNEMPEVEITES